MADYFDEYSFRSRVGNALTRVTQILGTAKNPTYPAELQHKYEDKYALANYLTNVGAASVLQTIEAMGLTEADLKSFKNAVKSDHQSVTLRFEGVEKCAYLREATREVEGPTYVTETKSAVFGAATKKEKVVTKITEYFYSFETEWSVSIYVGSRSEQGKKLMSRSSNKFELVSSTKNFPRPQVKPVGPFETSLTWLLSLLSPSDQFTFSIARDDVSCRTPRRNHEIDTAFQFFSGWAAWCNNVWSYFVQVFSVQVNHGLDINAVNGNGVFVPVVPLFCESGTNNNSNSNESSLILRVSESNLFLEEEKKSLSAKIAQIKTIFPDHSKATIISSVECGLGVIVLHGVDITTHYHSGVDYIEFMLKKQLIAAIGKEVGAVDFTNYMTYHYRKLYKPQYQPKAFYYAIRRPDHYPEGTLSIEAKVDGGDGMSEPISTVVRSVTEGVHTMYFNLNAGTRVSFRGERYLHAYVMNSFQGQTGLSLSLIARARQFSSFMLVVGKIAGPTLFQPKNAIIIQNKDELTIPLMLEQLPTAKEFRDAIESLSPEQKRFAQAYRSMQLEGSLFGVLIIQLKPQLEKLLNLPYDSLTKEIKLSQNLLELFIKYQIPSDLLSFTGLPSASLENKLETVRGYVTQMYALIDDLNSKSLQEAKDKAKYNVLDNISSSENLYFEEAPRRRLDVDFMMKEERVQDESVQVEKRSRSMKKEKSMPKPSAKLQRAISPQSSRGAPGGGGATAVTVSTSTISTPAHTSTSTSSTSTNTSSNANSNSNSNANTNTNNSSPGNASYSSVDMAEEAEVEDYTQLPVELDSEIGLLDSDGSLRSTIISTSESWSRSSQANLLASPQTDNLLADQQKTEHNKALDLLDALSRSGSLMLESTSLHVLMATTHCFDKNLMDSVIKDNINPIEKLERSSLIVAKAIHGVTPVELINSDQNTRLKSFNPKLFIEQ